MTAIQAIAGALPTVEAIFDKVSVSTGKCHIMEGKSLKRIAPEVLSYKEVLARIWKSKWSKRSFLLNRRPAHWSMSPLLNLYLSTHLFSVSKSYIAQFSNNAADHKVSGHFGFQRYDFET
jgi:hypothetical protein